MGRSTDTGAILGRGRLRVPSWETLEQVGLGATIRYSRRQHKRLIKFKYFSRVEASGYGEAMWIKHFLDF